MNLLSNVDQLSPRFFRMFTLVSPVLLFNLPPPPPNLIEGVSY